MTNMDRAQEIAEGLRQEPYELLRNDCIRKSVRFKRVCQSEGISARVAVCIGLSKTRLFRRWVVIPVIHAWGEVDGTRVETSRPLGSSGFWGIVPVNIRPIITIRF